MNKYLASSIVLLFVVPVAGQDRISREFGGLYGQVEVGGPYAGAEFHGSRPLPRESACMSRPRTAST